MQWERHQKTQRTRGLREVLRGSIGESGLWTEAGVCIRVVGCGSSNAMFELFFHGQLFKTKQVNKRFCGISGIRDSKEALSTWTWRARAVPNSKGQLATNSEGQEQWHLYLFPSSISCHCLPKDKQKPKNKGPVTLAPEAHKEKNREWFWEKGEHRNTDWYS